MRGRGNNGRKNSNPRSNNYDSNGPEVKVRGSAQQVVEKYLALARDATLTDDRVAAENYFQHAEHYFRLMTANGGGSEQRDQAASQPAASDKQPQDDAQPSGDSAAPPEASAAQSDESPVEENTVEGQAAPVDDPASAPQPEIGDGDNARPD
jgi:hypothetical protein